MTVTAIEPTRVDTPAVRAIVLDCACATDGIVEAMETGFRDLMAAAGRCGVTVAGPPRAIYRAYGADGVRFTLAIPIAEGTPGPSDENVRIEYLESASSLRFTHHGPFRDLMRTYGALTTWLVDHHYMSTESDWNRYMPTWEEYVTDPGTTAPDEMITFIHVPLLNREAH